MKTNQTETLRKANELTLCAEPHSVEAARCEEQNILFPWHPGTLPPHPPAALPCFDGPQSKFAVNPELPCSAQVLRRRLCAQRMPKCSSPQEAWQNKFVLFLFMCVWLWVCVRGCVCRFVVLARQRANTVSAKTAATKCIKSQLRLQLQLSRRWKLWPCEGAEGREEGVPSCVWLRLYCNGFCAAPAKLPKFGIVFLHGYP